MIAFCAELCSLLCTSFVFCLCLDSLAVARLKAKKAEVTSNLDSAASEVEKESRKSRARAFPSDDSDEAESIMNVKKSKKVSTALLPPLPPPVKMTHSLPAPQPTASTLTQNTPECSLNKDLATTKKSATAKKVSAPLLPPLSPQSPQASKQRMRQSWLLLHNNIV